MHLRENLNRIERHLDASLLLGRVPQWGRRLYWEGDFTVSCGFLSRGFQSRNSTIWCIPDLIYRKMNAFIPMQRSNNFSNNHLKSEHILNPIVNAPTHASPLSSNALSYDPPDSGEPTSPLT